MSTWISPHRQRQTDHSHSTFTMVMILRVASVCPPLQTAMPDEAEAVISTGKRNLRRFSGSVREFRWHMEVLDKLDVACQGLTTMA